MNFESTINQIIEDEYKGIRSDIYGELDIQLNKREEEYITPAIIVLPLSIQNIKNSYMFKFLIDSGSTHTLINQQTLPKGTKLKKHERLIVNTTIVGQYKMDEKLL
jgi:hypothetical protein